MRVNTSLAELAKTPMERLPSRRIQRIACVYLTYVVIKKMPAAAKAGSIVAFLFGLISEKAFLFPSHLCVFSSSSSAQK